MSHYEHETRSLIAAMAEAGWNVIAADDSEDRIETTDTDEAVAQVMAADDGYLYLRHDEGHNAWAWLVYGNNPGELVSDYGVSKGGRESFDAAWGAWSDAYCNAHA